MLEISIFFDWFSLLINYSRIYVQCKKISMLKKFYYCNALCSNNIVYLFINTLVYMLLWIHFLLKWIILLIFQRPFLYYFLLLQICILRCSSRACSERWMGEWMGQTVFSLGKLGRTTSFNFIFVFFLH